VGFQLLRLSCVQHPLPPHISLGELPAGNVTYQLLGCERFHEGLYLTSTPRCRMSHGVVVVARSAA